MNSVNEGYTSEWYLVYVFIFMLCEGVDGLLLIDNEWKLMNWADKVEIVINYKLFGIKMKY